MPGIAGIIAPHAGTMHPTIAKQMVAIMQHRPDDVIGTLSVPECGLNAGWVAHAGSFAARQSQTAAPGSARLLWSGECFSPHGSGPPPTDPTDPISLMARYETEGEHLVASLNGLFSGLLVDARDRRVLLFNDRFGCERLFVHEKEGTVYFASEAKALLRVLPELRAFDEAGVADFLTYGSTLEGRTLFRGLKMLPGGSLLRFTPGGMIERSRYFVPGQWEDQDPLGGEDFERTFIETFHRRLPDYFKTDLSLGISLTAGLDTRMIMACLPPGLSAKCYTYAATGGDTLDLRIGRRVAAISGLAHHTLRVSPSFTAEFGAHLDRTVHVTDGSAGALGAHELHLTQQACELAPVRLTGNFGSEVLRSMSTFKPLELDSDLVDELWRSPIAQAVERVASRQTHPVTHAAFEEVPWHLFGIPQAGRSQITVRTPFLDNDIVALAYRAPAQLRRSSRTALRLIRQNSPSLSGVPTDRGLAWPGPTWHSSARRVASSVTFKLDYWHKEGLPSALSMTEPWFSALDALGLLGLHKFLPYRRWFRHECAAYVADVVADVRKRHMPFWNSQFLATLADDHVRGRHNRLRELNAVLTLEAVDRLLIGNTTPTGTSHGLA